MWKKLNRLQQRVVLGASIVAVLMILFPPMNIERTIPGLTDGRRNLTLEVTEFAGWGFIGQIDTSPSQRPRFKDPNNPTLLERFEAARPISVEEIREGKKRLDFSTLLKQLLVLLGVAAAAIYLTRSESSEQGPE